MSYFFDTAATLGVLSGVALVALGTTTLAVKPRSRASIAFAVMAMLWGSAVAAANMASMTDAPATAEMWLRLMIILYIPLYFYVLDFVLHHPRPATILTRRPLLRSALAAPAVVALGAAVLWPSLFVVDVVRGPIGMPVAQVGPLFSPVLRASSVLVFAAALWIVLRRLRDEEGVVTRSQLGLLAAAFLLYTSYRAGPLPWLVWEMGERAASEGVALFTLRLIATAAVFASTAAALWVAWRDRQLPWRGLLIGAAVVPLLVRVAENLATHTGWPSFVTSQYTVGFWRLVAVALFAYAIARFRLFDLDLRLKLTISRTTMAAIFLAVFFAVSELAAAYFTDRTDSTLFGVLAAAGLVFVMAPLQRFSDRFSDAAMPRVRPTQEYMSYRKLEVYRGALEGAHSDGVLTEKERDILDRLATDLDIAPADAQAMERDLGIAV